MAIGFPPKHQETYILKDLTPSQILVLAVETAQKMNWKIGYLNQNGLIAYAEVGKFSKNSEIMIKIENDIATLTSTSTGTGMMDGGKNKHFIKEFISNLEQLKFSSTNEELDRKYEFLKENFVSEQEDLVNSPTETITDKFNNILGILIPKEGFFITPIIIDLNIIVFILMVLSGVNVMLPDNDSLLIWGANFRPLTLDGQPWRIITSCFLHIGIFHLLMNMYALYYIGVLLEPFLGKTRFISAYLLTGIASSMTSLWWNDLIISAGASGAIFGMYGVFFALLLSNIIEKESKKALLSSIGIFVVFNLVIGLQDGIDGAAHLGGLISGLVIGFSFVPSLKNPVKPLLKYASIGLMSVLILVSSFVVYHKIPNNIGDYDKKMETFSSNESLALEVYSLPENTPSEKLLYGLKEHGIYYWEENIEILKGFDEMDLPLVLKTRNQLLKEYCELRIKSYELNFKSISEDTKNYDSQISEYDKKIELIFKKLEEK